MNVFLKMGTIIGLQILLFSMSVNASPLSSSKKSPVKSQMEQLTEVYKILMAAKRAKNAKPTISKSKPY